MKTIYNYLFYKIYRLINRLGNYDVAFSAMMPFITLIYLNIITIMFFIKPINNINKANYKIVIIIIGVFLLVINYFFFIYKNKYKRLIKQFENETKRQQVLGSLLVSSYAILSFILFFIVVL